MQMLRAVTIGQFVPGVSAIHRLDPRAKIGMLVMGMVSIFTCQHLAPVAAAGALTIVAAVVSGFSVRWFVGGLRSIGLLVLVTLVANIIFGRGDTPLVHAGPIAVSVPALQHGLMMSMRLVSLFLMTSLFTLTTSPIRLTDALESILWPLRAVGLRTAELSMTMSIALRFVPTLVDTTERIMNAQLSRGARFNEGRLLSRTRAMVPVLVPLFVQAFQAADALAEAMEARCYRGGEGRTRLATLSTTTVDLGGVVLCGLLALGLARLDACAWPAWM